MKCLGVISSLLLLSQTAAAGWVYVHYEALNVAPAVCEGVGSADSDYRKAYDVAHLQPMYDYHLRGGNDRFFLGYGGCRAPQMKIAELYQGADENIASLVADRLSFHGQFIDFTFNALPAKKLIAHYYLRTMYSVPESEVRDMAIREVQTLYKEQYGFFNNLCAHSQAILDFVKGTPKEKEINAFLRKHPQDYQLGYVAELVTTSGSVFMDGGNWYCGRGQPR